MFWSLTNMKIYSKILVNNSLTLDRSWISKRVSKRIVHFWMINVSLTYVIEDIKQISSSKYFYSFIAKVLQEIRIFFQFTVPILWSVNSVQLILSFSENRISSFYFFVESHNVIWICCFGTNILHSLKKLILTLLCKMMSPIGCQTVICI